MTLSYQDIAEDISVHLAENGENAVEIRVARSVDLQKDLSAFVTAAQAAWLEATGLESQTWQPCASSRRKRLGRSDPGFERR